MMALFDPTPPGEQSPLNGVDPIAPALSGVTESCEQLEPTLFFDAQGDVEILEDEGVGFPCNDFRPGKD